MQKILPSENSPSERSSSSMDEIHEDEDMAGMEEREREETTETKREISEIAGDESSRHPPNEDLSLLHDGSVDVHDSSPARDETLPTSTEGKQPSPEENQVTVGGRESQ